MERSLALYSLYVPVASAHFWASVFFLYFNARFPVERVLQLEAIYYAAVVLLEVPSGYFSDRLGRVPTLRISAAAAVLAQLLFLFGDDRFLWFAVAQLSLAVSFSFVSGTDAAFHYDTLTGLGRARDFAPRETRLHRNALLVRASSALAGGVAGVFDLRIAYVLSAATALLAFATTLGFAEPPRGGETQGRGGLGAQLRACAGRLRSPLLAWLFGYVVLQTSLEHVPYEFAQPYVAGVLGESIGALRATPLATGLVTAAIAAVGAFAAAASLGLRRRLGTAGALLAVTGLQLVVVGAMASGVRAWVLPLIALRSVHPAVSQVLVRAEVTPRVPQSLRATYLSLQSLVGRLGYSGLLLALGTLAGKAAEADGATLQMLLVACLVAGSAALVALAATVGATRRDVPRGDGPEGGASGP